MASYAVNELKFDRALLKLIFERAEREGRLGAASVELDDSQTPTLNAKQLKVLKEYWCLEDQFTIGAPEVVNHLFENPGLGFSQLADFEPDHQEDFVTLKLNSPLFALPPKESIKNGAIVAVDFGTSSTVVAIKQKGGDAELIRLGVDNWEAPPSPEQFENPTLFQIGDNTPLQGRGSWSLTYNRPSISLFAVKHANMAQADILDTYKSSAIPAEDKINFTYSIIDGLKSRLQQPAERQPINDLKGNLLDVGYGLSDEDSKLYLDAVEYYAWLIGRNINLHFRGYFPKYYLSFPVKFTTAERERLRSSFERGLRRSLPPAILYSDRFKRRFEVKLFKPEPIAFAASILGHEDGIELDLNIANNSQVFSIFDVGGGTSDFFYGKYRVSSGMGDETFSDYVLEGYKRDGMSHLGGERILHHICALVFAHNLGKFRVENVAFELPKDFSRDDLNGVEHLIGAGPFRTLNKRALMTELRHILTLDNSANWDSSISISVMSNDERSFTLELELPYDQIYAYVSQVFEDGVTRFLRSLAEVLESQAKEQHYIRDVKVVRSGNTCRSLFLRKIFEPELDYTVELEGIASEAQSAIISKLESLPSLEELRQRVFDQLTFAPPRLEVLPLLDHRSVKAVNPSPNLKTGTALGLLKLAPGGGLMHIEASEDHFEFHIGRIQRGEFIVALPRETKIAQSDWVMVNQYTEGGVEVYYSVAAQSEQISLDECKSELIEVEDAEDGYLWARAVSPTEVEFAVTEEMNERPAEGDEREFKIFSR